MSYAISEPENRRIRHNALVTIEKNQLLFIYKPLLNQEAVRKKSDPELYFE